MKHLAIRATGRRRPGGRYRPRPSRRHGPPRRRHRPPGRAGRPNEHAG